jgi:hypothetical protein
MAKSGQFQTFSECQYSLFQRRIAASNPTFKTVRTVKKLFDLLNHIVPIPIQPQPGELFRQLPLAKTAEDFEALLPWQLADQVA